MELAAFIHSMASSVLAHAQWLSSVRPSDDDVRLAIAAAMAAVVPARVLLFCIEVAGYLVSPTAR